MKDEKENYVKITIRLTERQKERLENRAEKSGVSMAEYVRSLLTKKALAVEPPMELWRLLDALYEVHDLLLRAKTPEFADAARKLEQRILDLQAAFTAPRKAAS